MQFQKQPPTMSNSRAHMLNDRVAHMLNDRMAHMSNDRVTHMLNDRVAHMLIDRVAHMLNDRMAHMLNDRVGASYRGHHGPVYAIQRHPYYPKYILSAGDWTVRLWVDDVRYIWDVSRSNTPEAELESTSQIVCSKYNPKELSVLVSGLYNGQLAFYDTRKSTRPIDSSSIEHSHRDPVYDVAWLQSKTAAECLSVSTDGFAYYWDIRKIAEPVDSLPLKEKGSSSALGGVSLDYEVAAGPTKFMVGTEQGAVLLCNRKAKHAADR
eukprot:gene15658-18568_t